MKKFFVSAAILTVAVSMFMSTGVLAQDNPLEDGIYFIQEFYVDENGNVDLIEKTTEVNPRFKLGKDLIAGVDIRDSVANVYAESNSYENMRHELTATIYESRDKKSWTSKKPYSEVEENNTTCIVDRDYITTRGRYYRVEAEVVWTKGSQKETASVTSSTQESYSLLDKES